MTKNRIDYRETARKLQLRLADLEATNADLVGVSRRADAAEDLGRERLNTIDDLRKQSLEKDSHINMLANQLEDANRKLAERDRLAESNRRKYERLKSDLMRTLGWVNAKLSLHPLEQSPSETEAIDRFNSTKPDSQVRP